VVDSVLVLIYAKTQKTRKLHTLLTEPNDVILGEVEATLIATQQFFALCKLYERTNQDEKLLETWAK
jgi:vacuolar protein sorting-associated protein 3